MNASTLLGLFVTGWMAQATPPAQAPAPAQPKPVSANLKLRIATSTYLSDGRVIGASASDWSLQLNQATTAYATSGRQLCDSRGPALTQPTDAGNGWRVTVTPMRDTTSELEVRVAWQQMWGGGQRLLTGKQGSAVLTLHPGDRVIVDYLNANSMPVWRFKPVTETFGKVGAIGRVGATGSVGDPPAFQKRFKLLANGADTGCNAVGMGLEIGLEPAKSLAVIEAELWLVRPNADGTERSDHQVVRLPLGQPTTSYFFDEQSLLTPLPAGVGLPTATVFGELSAFSVEGGKVHLNFSLSRRYKVGPAFSDRPGNEARTDANYRDLLATPGEVLAFQLPTIEVPVVVTTLTAGKPPTQTIASRRLPQLSVRLRAQIFR